MTLETEAQADDTRRHGGYCDIHCHCLPGLDDGPATMEESLELCEALVNDGASTVVATPHQLGRYDGLNESRLVRQLVGELQAQLDSRGIPLKVLPGGDVRIDERLARLIEEDRVTTVADGGKYLLLELPHEIYVDPTKILQELARMNIAPIVTHPERHIYLQRHPDTLEKWIDLGAAMQITAGSLLGEFGSAARNVSTYWMTKGWVSVIASDAHGRMRPPRMKAAIARISEKYAPIIAKELCVVNPARVVMGERLSPSKTLEWR